MTLESIYYIGQTVAVIAILASLAGISFQLRQTHRLAKLETSKSVWMEAGGRLVAQVDDAEKAEFLQRALFGTDEITDAEKTRLYITMAGMFVVFEAGFTMHTSRMMDERFWPRMRLSMRDYIAPPRAQRWWQIARERSFACHPEFTAEVDSLVAEINESRAERTA